MFEPGREGSGFPEEPGSSKPIVVETDGGTVPIVEPSRDAKDKRKGKKLPWREAKLSLAHAKGSRTPIYGGSSAGGVEAAGRQLLSCGARTGFGASSQVDAVGDGAPWMVGPGRGAVRRSRALFDRFLSCLRVFERRRRQRQRSPKIRKSSRPSA